MTRSVCRRPARIALGSLVLSSSLTAARAEVTPPAVMEAPAAPSSIAPLGADDIPTATTEVSPEEPEATPPAWVPDEGASFPSYRVFQDALVAALRKARTRVALLSTSFTDGDLATSVFGAKLRGLRVLVFVDPRELNRFSSRHDYFVRTGVPTFRFKLSTVHLGGHSTVVIDDLAWRVSTRLDDKTTNSVDVRRSPYTAEEIFGWTRAQGSEPLLTAPPVPAVGRGANSSTRVRRSVGMPSGTMEAKRPDFQRGTVPRRLPRETRLQGLQRGSADYEPLSIPPPSGAAGESRFPGNETDVTE